MMTSPRETSAIRKPRCSANAHQASSPEPLTLIAPAATPAIAQPAPVDSVNQPTWCPGCRRMITPPTTG